VSLMHVVQSQGSRCGICGWRSVTGEDMSLLNILHFHNSIKSLPLRYVISSTHRQPLVVARHLK